MSEPTHFLNVDLDVDSAHDLQPLADALGDRLVPMWVGRVKRTYKAHFELSRWRKKEDANVVIRDFCQLIESLPRSGRRLWSSAKKRTFDIGIQAGMEPKGWGTAIAADTVKAAAKLGADIAITVYAPQIDSEKSDG